MHAENGMPFLALANAIPCSLFDMAHVTITVFSDDVRHDPWIDGVAHIPESNGDHRVQRDMSLAALRDIYRSGVSPTGIVTAVHAAIIADAGRNVWIHVADRDALIETAHALEQRRRDGANLPLYGIPFGVKDNIDVAGMPTTAACPEFSYTPTRSARSVEALVEAGAICMGKTNLDQFATGLCGFRSPYGACASAYHPDYVSGGSSSGSAVAVAARHVSFALGTDTGGSGRIPAGFNDIVGIKPTLGRLSTRGLVPNCPSLDCVSIFALTAGDAMAVFRIVDGFDSDDPFARRAPDSAAPASCGGSFSFGRLNERSLETFGMPECADAYWKACHRLEAIGGSPYDVDFSLFVECGAMLFDGAWIAERRNSLADFAARHPGSLLPVIENVVAAGSAITGADVFTAQHRQARLKRRFEQEFGHLTTIVVPTAPRPFTLAEMAADPIGANNRLGHYSYAANLLDLCAIAVPNVILSSGVPMGVTFLAPAWRDELVADLADRFANAQTPAAREPTRTPLRRVV